MNEWEKGQKGYLYDANNDPGVMAKHLDCLNQCFELNNISPCKKSEREERLRRIIKEIGPDFDILSPFFCDFGENIHIGRNFYANHNLSILDGGRVEIGDYVFIAPNVVITTAGHAIDPGQRDRGLEIALPVKIGSHVWLGANVCVLPGVAIGDNVVIGAGSVVTKNIPDNVVAAGSPCRILRDITEDDKNKYPIFKE
ncbi:MAG: sugar O-acetyltransferase [Candidatus Limivicinus sp.]